jgi:Uma2 family endonuclease
LYRLSIERYHAMCVQGILTTNDSVELIHGLLVRKKASNPARSTGCGLTQDVLTAIKPPSWHVRMKAPVTLATSEPEPDNSLARGRVRDYTARHPGAGDIGLVVEVSDSTLDYDRTTKLALYAAARIPAYWIVNLVENVLEVYTGPRGTGEAADYADVQRLGSDQTVVLTLDGVATPAINVRDLLP